jgi:hypothetical protein
MYDNIPSPRALIPGFDINCILPSQRHDWSISPLLSGPACLASSLQLDSTTFFQHAASYISPFPCFYEAEIHQFEASPDIHCIQQIREQPASTICSPRLQRRPGTTETSKSGLSPASSTTSWNILPRKSIILLPSEDKRRPGRAKPLQPPAEGRVQRAVASTQTGRKRELIYTLSHL